ncbi:Hypothetical protein, putative [Bodo saltans]|uniref:Pyrrolo-quinoline quinone repeat domain-containing protein n=1 Tax=Bodo saltans TaxID=75058 RepID=A0A0S4JSW5_BODSA|nr:Hypothetical protein, putative [Bodo saltans]|eukprot:CUG93300.1 Hypothetical protein, putative [Bodo saltans]
MFWQSVLVTFALATTLVSGGLHRTIAPPSTLWARNDVGTVPFAPSMVLGSFGVTAELRKNTTTSATYIRGINTTNGNQLWLREGAELCGDLQFIDTFSDDVHFVLGCQYHFLISTIATGAQVLKVDLPVNLVLTPFATGITADAYSAFTASTKKFLVLNVQHNVTQDCGVVVFDVDNSQLTNSSFVEQCPPTTFVNSVFIEGSAGMIVVCNMYQVSYVSLQTFSRVWVNSTVGTQQFTPAIFSSGSSETNLALGYYDNLNHNYIVGYLGNTKNSPAWSASLPQFAAAVAGFGEKVIVVTSAFVYAFDGTTGAMLWNTTNFQLLQPVIVTNLMFGANIFVFDESSVYQLSAETGKVLSSVDPTFFMNPPIFPVAAPISYLYSPYDSATVVPSAPQYFLALGTSNGLLLWNCTADSCDPDATELSFGGVQSPIAVVSLGTTTDKGLLIQTNNELVMYSLSNGWTVATVDTASVQENVLFVNDGNGVAALDRNGFTLWWTAGDFTTFDAATPTPFMSNLVFNLAGSSLVALNTYNGTVAQTLRMHSDCFSNTSLIPTISEIVPDSTNSNAYFTAGLPCLFRIGNDLSLHSIPLPLIASPTLVLDDDNGLAYYTTSHQLVTVSIPLGLTTRVLYASPSTIQYILPSSTWSSPQNLGKGMNPLIYIATATQLLALDVIDRANTVVWGVNIVVSTITYYNNFLYVISPSSGLCKISLNLTVTPSSNRIVWCAGASLLQQDQETTSVIVTPSGIALAVFGNGVIAVDAVSGRPRWSVSAGITLTAGYGCNSMVLDNDHYILFVSCDQSAYALDVLQSGHVLYQFQASEAVLTYFDGTVFAVSEQTVSGFPIPPAYRTRRSYPTPIPTTEPTAETLPPGFIPMPIPNPTAGPYPLPSTINNGFPHGLSKIAIADEDFQVGTGSGLIGSGPFSDIVFTTPRGNEQRIVSVQAYNTTSDEFVWSTDVTESMEPYLTFGCGESYLCAATGVFIATCNGNLFAFNAQNGMPLWNNTNVFFSRTVMWAPSATTDDCTLMGISSNNFNLTGLATRDGAQLFSVLVTASNDATTVKLFEPAGKNIAFVGLVGPSGLVFVQIGPSRTHAEISYTVTPGSGTTNPDQFCSTSRPIVAGGPALTSISNNVYANTDYAYFACFHSVEARHVAVFRVNLLLSSVTVLQNVSLGASDSIQYMLIEAATNIMAPQIYLAFSDLIYKIDATSGLIRWITPGQFGVGLGISNTFVLAAMLSDNGNNQPIGFFNKSTGEYLWNVTVQVASNEQTQLVTKILTADVAPGYLVFGIVGVFGISYTAESATLFWTGSAASNGWLNGLQVVPSSNFVSLSPTVEPVYEAVITLLNSQTTYFQKLLFTLKSEEPVENTLWASFVGAPSTTDGNPFHLLVANNPEDENNGPFAAFPEGWVGLAYATAFNEVVLPGVPSIPVAIVFAEQYVAFYHQTSGQEISRLFFTDYCESSSTGLGLGVIMNTRIIGSKIYFADSSCLYEIDLPNNKAVRSVVLSKAATLAVGESIVTSDNSTFIAFSASGAVFSVNIAAMNVNWISDALQFVALESLGGLVLPTYDASIPVAQQQLFAYSTNGVVSFALGTGQVAWVRFFEQTSGIVALPDGHLLQLTAGGTMKLNTSLALPPYSDRVIWETPTGAVAEPYDEILACTFIIPLSNVVVLAYDNAFALSLTTGDVVWNVSLGENGGDCTNVFTLPDPRAANLPPPYVAITDEENNMRVLSTATGVEAYVFDAPVAYLPQASNGWLAVCTSEGYAQQLPYPLPLQPITTTPLPAAVVAQTATIPTTYVFPPPDVNSTSITFTASATPIALTLWQVSANVPTNLEDTDVVGVFTVTAEINGQDVLVQTLAYESFSASTEAYIYASVVSVVDSLSGVTLSSVTDTTCKAIGLLSISKHIAVSVCQPLTSDGSINFQKNSVLSFLDTKSAALNVLATLTVPQLNFFSTDASPTIIVMPEYDLACIIGQLTTTPFCFGTNPIFNGTFAKILFNISCPMVLGTTPVYDSAYQLILYSCFNNAPSGSAPNFINAIVALNAASGAVVWNTSLGDLQPYQVAYSNNFGVVMSSTSSFGMINVQGFSLATGAFVTPLINNSFPDQNMNVIVSLFLVERAVAPLDLNIVFLTHSKIVGYSTKSAAIVWDVFFTADNVETVAATLILQDPSRNNSATIYAGFFDETQGAGVVVVIDPMVNFANELYRRSIENQFGMNQIIFQLVSITMYPSALGMIINFGNTVAYLDLQAKSVAFVAPTSYSTAQNTLVYSKFAPAAQTWHTVLDYVTLDGTTTQVLVNPTTEASSVYIQLAPVSATTSTSTEELLIGSQAGGGTFAFYANGTFKWGTRTPIYATQYYLQFTPILVDEGPNNRPIIVNQFNARGFYAYDAQNGTVVYQGYLPLCINGQGSQQIDTSRTGTTTTVDAANGLVYFSVVNSCLYALNTRTGAVSQTVVKGGIPLVPQLLTTMRCIIAIDAFGGIWCYPRGAALSQTAQWTVSMGYSGDILSASVKYFGDLLFINLGSELVCISELSGLILWRIDLGARLSYSTYNASSVIARTWTGVYVINVDPSLPASQRIQSFISTTTLFGAPYQGPTLGDNGNLIDPIVTANGVILAAYTYNIFGISMRRMAVVYHVNLPQTTIESVAYSAAPGVNSEPATDNHRERRVLSRPGCQQCLYRQHRCCTTVLRCGWNTADRSERRSV